jgi:hypothetical protein
MRHYQIIFIEIFFLLFLIGCTTDENRPRTNQYYDLETFVKGQITTLNSLHPEVNKKVVSGEIQESKALTTVQWQKELDLFVQADLNKPAYRNSYVTERPSAHTIVYKAKAGEDVPVKFLKLELDPISSQLASAEALMTSENYLYESEKKVVMHCGMNQQKQWLLRDYEVTGFQKLIFMAKKPFEITGKVL